MIEYVDLPEEAQSIIDGYPEEQTFKFYYNPATQEVRVVADNLSGLLQAQGGMGPEWQAVVFENSEEQGE